MKIKFENISEVIQFLKTHFKEIEFDFSEIQSEWVRCGDPPNEPSSLCNSKYYDYHSLLSPSEQHKYYKLALNYQLNKLENTELSRIDLVKIIKSKIIPNATLYLADLIAKKIIEQRKK